MKRVKEDCLNILDKTRSTKVFYGFSSHKGNNLLHLVNDPSISESWAPVKH